MLAHKSPHRSPFPYLLTALFAASAAIAQEVHFSPEERLDAIDAGLIATAKGSIDFASYALTDHVVLDALNGAEHRGVVVRVVLDPRERHDFVKLGDLSDNLWTSPAQGDLLGSAAGMHESIRPVAGRFAPLALMGVRCFWPHNMIGLEGLVVDQA
jgi:hypothetical protein